MSSKSRIKYSLLNMFAGYIGFFINTLIGFICRMVFTRCLAKEYLGISGLFTNILTVLSLAELGIGAAISYALYKPLAENDERKIASLMKFYSSAYKIIGTIVAVVGLALLPFLKFLIDDTPNIKESVYLIYIMYLFNTVLSYFFSYRITLLTADQRNYVQILISYSITITQSIIQIIFLLITHEFISYLIIQTIGGVSFNLIVSHKVKKDYPYICGKNIEPITKEEKNSLFVNIKALTCNKIAEILVNSTDNIIITYFCGLVTVGLVSNYLLFINVISNVTSQIFNGILASVGNFNATKNSEESFKLYKVLQFANFVVFGFTFMVILFISSDFVMMFFGEDFQLPFYIPIILSLNYYMVHMQNASSTFRTAMGLFKYGQYVFLITAITNIILSIWWGHLWGLIGIYIATAVARMLTNEWYIPYAVNIFGFNKNPMIYFKIHMEYICVLVIDSIICYIIFKFLHFYILINIILKFVICSSVFILSLYLLYRKTEEYSFLVLKFKFIIGSINKKLKKVVKCISK